ncbi:MAG: cold shock domain-containing protein [Saprospiraceae bacterium]|nr:cold shock domain-containing protein [Lewinellaceae bacterium]
MAKSQQTFNKKEKEKKRRKKWQDKQERREQRKQEKAEQGKKTFEEMLSYVDEDGNITSTPPDPSKRKKIKAEDIVLGVPPRDDTPIDPVHNGRVKFFNDEKGYGFITDTATQESIFVHINNTDGQIQENDKVTFEIEMGPKGASAVNVKIVSA